VAEKEAMFKWKGMRKVNRGGMRGQEKNLGNDFDKLTLNCSPFFTFINMQLCDKNILLLEI